MDFLLSLVAVVVSYFLYKKEIDFKKILIVFIVWGIAINIPNIIDTFESLSALYTIVLLVTGIIIPSIINAFISKFSYKASAHSFIMYFLINAVLGLIIIKTYEVIILGVLKMIF